MDLSVAIVMMVNSSAVMETVQDEDRLIHLDNKAEYSSHSFELSCPVAGENIYTNQSSTAQV